MMVLFTPWALSQCVTTWEPRPKLNAQHPLVQQSNNIVRVLANTETPLRWHNGRSWMARSRRARYTLSTGKMARKDKPRSHRGETEQGDPRGVRCLMRGYHGSVKPVRTRNRRASFEAAC